MSYAEAAAKGGPQPPSELTCVKSRAPAPPVVEKTESVSTASLVDVDAPSVQSVHSDFLNQEVQTTTQADRLEREAQEALAREQAASSGKKGKGKKGRGRLGKNAQNPVYLGNAFVITALSAGLGYGAYRKHAEGKLSWEAVGLWAGAVGLFAGADYFVSKWLLQNKYPKKD